MYSVKQVGGIYTMGFKLYLEKDGKIISPFHDIPLYVNDGDRMVVNVVNEIPRFEMGKFEISKEDEKNPIKQDVKKGNLRFSKNIYPFYGYPFNYGALPQTWEDPNVVDRRTGEKGDNDPIDVVDISQVVKKMGEVYQAEILGVLAMIDEGETDWKIIVRDVREKDAVFSDKLKEDIRFWFKNYKIPDGKPANSFAFNGEFKDAEFASEIVAEGHTAWKGLMKNGAKNISTVSEGFTLDGDAKEDGVVPAELKKFSFVN
ncbi:inorganic pyrophosphatase [Enteropsectra breve]|nr:inorganic pyrophosphatase [Enteropsectra breve]